MIKVRLDQNGYVEGFAVIGDIEGSVVFRGEIPEGFNAKTCRCYRLTGADTLVLDKEKLDYMQNIPALREELAALQNWFSRYDMRVMQYLRAQRLGQACATDVGELDKQAQMKEARINELKTALNQE